MPKKATWKGDNMNQGIKKAAPTGAIIMISSASAALLAIFSVLISLATGSSARISLIIALIVLPTIVSVWFLASMVAYTVGKYKGRISAWTDVNLRASSLIIGVILLAAAISLTVLALYWRVDPISVIFAVIRG